MYLCTFTLYVSTLDIGNTKKKILSSILDWFVSPFYFYFEKNTSHIYHKPQCPVQCTGRSRETAVLPWLGIQG